MGTKTKEEIYLTGSPVSDGIAIGRLYHLRKFDAVDLPTVTIEKSQVEGEIDRFRSALSCSKDDLEKLQSSLLLEGSNEAVGILDTHKQMLEDPVLTTDVEEDIRNGLLDPESAFRKVITNYERQFEAVDDAFFQERLTDIRDLASRVLGHLRPMGDAPSIPQGSVIFAKELIPSDTAEAPQSSAAAFLSEKGGETSHAALIARAKGVPFVANVDFTILENADDTIVIVDGTKGFVILNPTNETLDRYESLSEEHRGRQVYILKEAHKPSITQDGEKIHVLANLEHLEDLSFLNKVGAEGIGLLRSEFLFMNRDIGYCTEEEQHEVYHYLFNQTNQMPVTFRLFDIGADKTLSKELLNEVNPALGCRSIRFLLRHRHIFRAQLTALLRASTNKNVRLMLPFVSDITELREVKQCVHEIASSLGIEHIPPIGCMIETPSAVVMSDLLAKESDFLSIGTNDLLQYTLAVDRTNAGISDIYKATHPSMVRMIEMVVKSAQTHGVPLSICGEMASNPLFAPLLIGLGIRTISCAPRYIPIIKHTLRNISVEGAHQITEKAKTLETASQVNDLLTHAIANS
ncbi:MAG: phosphoenolpyruvate--protein phosphotransferase [Simkaniaceae bacterium]|nr:phosphoenolpyruvate--protein phosphotransferase [Simkaniaceae bacterium]